MPGLDTFRHKLATRSIRKGDAQKALHHLHKVKHETAQTLWLRGVAHFDLMHLAEAEAALQSALKLDAHVETARLLADTLVLSDKWEAAWDVLAPFRNNQHAFDLVRVIESDAKIQQRYQRYLRHITKAMFELRNRNYKNSIALLKKAMQYTDDTSRIKKQIGGIYLNYLRNDKEAEKYMKDN